MIGHMGDVFAQGEILAGGRYRIDGLLGSGGMAQVYRAYDLSLARAVAVKTMLPGLAIDASHPSDSGAKRRLWPRSGTRTW